MSSPEEDYNDGDLASQNAKKRRIQRACDMCRRKKSTSAHSRTHILNADPPHSCPAVRCKLPFVLSPETLLASRSYDEEALTSASPRSHHQAMARRCPTTAVPTVSPIVSSAPMSKLPRCVIRPIPVRSAIPQLPAEARASQRVSNALSLLSWNLSKSPSCIACAQLRRVPRDPIREDGETAQQGAFAHSYISVRTSATTDFLRPGFWGG